MTALLAAIVLATVTLPCAAADTGAIKGTVTRGGAAQEPVEHAVVLVDGPRIPAPPDAPHVVMDQRDRMFVPTVLAVPVGTTVEFPNHDSVVHNVSSTGPANAFDLGMYGAGETRSIRLDEPGVSEIRCNVHPAMRAVIVVHTNPYVAVTDAAGGFTITGVPPGRYKVRVWHRVLSARPVPVTVRAGAVVPLAFELGRRRPAGP